MAADEGQRRQAGAGVRVLGFVGALVAFVFVLARLGSPSPESEAPPASSARAPADPAAPPGAIALLGGLAAGAEIAGWKVASISRASATDVKDAIALSFEKDGKSFIVWIAPKGRIPHNAPIETASYAIFYGHFENAVEADAPPVLDALKARVTEGEAKVGPQAF